MAHTALNSIVTNELCNSFGTGKLDKLFLHTQASKYSVSICFLYNKPLLNTETYDSIYLKIIISFLCKSILYKMLA